MNRDLQTKLNQYAKARKKKRKWLTVIASLCAVVAVGTSYILINPADTAQQETFCGFEEHKEHADDCYEKVLACQLSEEEHEHSDTCYGTEEYLSCGSEETDGHQHCDGCYETERVLICSGTNEEHIHTAECYEEKEILTCQLEECEPHHHDESCYEMQTVCTCGMEECEPHQHSEECYEINLDHLICELPIHEHTLQCFSNPDADVETASVWERTFENVELSGNWNEDVIAIAKTQIGVGESTANYEVQSDGATMKGITRYGQWYGDPYGDWCAMFCSFCINYAEVDRALMPVESSCSRWVDELSSRGLFRGADYTPMSGDLVFFDYDDDNLSDHVGLVYEVADGKLRTIEGNNGNYVMYCTYDATDAQILGYGALPENPNAPAEEEKPEQNEPRLRAVTDMSQVGGHVSVTVAEAKKAPLKKSAELMTAGAPVLFASKPSSATGPLNVGNYIPVRGEGAQPAVRLEYKDKDAAETDPWIDVTTLSDGESIPGDAKLQLSVDFEKVKITDLQAAGYQMAFSVPAIMNDPTVSEIITSGIVEVGELSVSGDTVTFTFFDDWVDSQQAYDTDGTPIDSFIQGDFWVRSNVDLEEAKELHPGTIVVGGVEIVVNFDPNVIGEYGDVGITKSPAELSQDKETGKWYLTYNLMVEAGEYGCPKVSVKDKFDANDYTGAYEILGATKKTAGEESETEIDFNGTIQTQLYGGGMIDEVTWSIGDMAPFEMYTLTYRVPLDDSYIGGQVKDTLDNRATVYFDDMVEKSHANVSFTPKADVTITKIKSSYSKINTAEGGYFIYRVLVTAPDTNAYPLENVIIWDALDGTISNGTPTPENIRQYLEYDLTDDPTTSNDNTTWWTMKGTSTSASNRIKQYLEEDIVFTPDTNGDGRRNDGFSVNIGTLNPGDQVAFRYKVKIDKDVFPEIGATDGKINNMAAVQLDGDEDPYMAVSHTESITHKQWSRKLGSERNPNKLWIPVDNADGVYDYTLAPKAHPTVPDGDEEHTGETGFYVPAGSYLYQIVANETGDWDVSSASMTDMLEDKAEMQYQGYVRVDAYSITTPVAGTTDAEVIANMSGMTPAMTSWVYVNGQTSFSFKPDNVFKNEDGDPVPGNYAYLLTYYAKPDTTDPLNNVVVANLFRMGGEIGPGGEYILVGVEASADVVVQENISFGAEKFPWYYANPIEEPIENFTNYGALYWVIKADGTIPAGTVFKDYSGTTANYWGYYRSNSIVGVYLGNLGDNAPMSYADLASFMAAVDADPGMTLTPLTANEDYTVEYKNSSDENVTPTGTNASRSYITMNQEIRPGPGESLYIIYRTSPSSGNYPTSNTGSRTYTNLLSTKLPDQDDYSTEQAAKQTLYTREYMYKSGYLGEYYDADGTGKKLTGSLTSYLTTDMLKNGTTDLHEIPVGTYIGWNIMIDQWCNMNGRYRFIDRLPEGLSPEFVKLFRVDTDFINGVRQNVQIPADERPGWTEHVTVMTFTEWESDTTYYTPLQTYTFYWYTDGSNRVMFDLDNFNPDVNNNKHVQVLIGTRVTEPDVLLYGKQGDYTNTAEIYDSDGHKIDQSSANVKVTKTTLEKRLAAEKVNPLPFTITVNKMGEDLVPGTSTVSIVDTLSDTLRLDPATVEVKNPLTGQVLTPVTDWKIAVDGQTFTLEIPDEMPLTITYKAYLSVLPDVDVTVWNDAYWEGQEPPTEHTVYIENYHYEGGGSASATTPPRLEIIKHDANNAGQTLANASFKVERMNVDESTGELSMDTGFETLTGVTGPDGKLIFANGALEVNTVYCVTETQAPYAYRLDNTPHYFIVAKKIEQPKLDENGQPMEDEQGRLITEEVYPAFIEKLNTTNPDPGPGEAVYVGLQYYDLNTKYSMDVYDPTLEYELPMTGGVGTIPVYTLGGLLLAGAIMCVCKLRRRRERGAE